MNKTNYIEAVAGNVASVTAGAYQYDRGSKLRVDGTTALLLQPPAEAVLLYRLKIPGFPSVFLFASALR